MREYLFRGKKDNKLRDIPDSECLNCERYCMCDEEEKRAKSLEAKILFRGKGVGEKNWTYGTFVAPNYIVGRMIESHDDHCILESWLPIDPETVGQCLNDDDGGRIFEGDIFPIENEGAYIVGVVRYCENTMKVVLDTYGSCDEWNGLYDETHEGYLGTDDFDDFCFKPSDIIGNIHDNKDLLEAK